MLAAAEYFAPAGATRGLSDRPLDPFGPMLVEYFARVEAESFTIPPQYEKGILFHTDI